MLLTLILGSLVLFLLWDILRPDPTPISGVYRQKGRCYYIKKWIFGFLLWLNARKQTTERKGERSGKDRQKRGYGQSITDIDSLEEVHELENDPFAISTSYFNGFSQDGTQLALRVARKHNREAEVWVMLNIPGVGYFQHPLHPDTMVCNTEPGGYTAGGCQFTMVEPMRCWKVTYNGYLRKGLCNSLDNKPEDLVYVKLSLTWNSLADPFNFDVDLDKNLLCNAIAREKWTAQFWKTLRGKHQTHYEQVGEMYGRIEVEGVPTKTVHLKSFRDHTFGVRDWAMFHRYAIHFINVDETGLMAMIAVLCMPGYISYLKTGYLVYASGETFPVSDIKLNLWEIMDKPTPEQVYYFSFTAGGSVFHVLLKEILTPTVYHYTDRRSKVMERFCTYLVNGKSARGLTEYHYSYPEVPAMDRVPVSKPLLSEPTPPECQSRAGELTLAFKQRACCNSEFVGGKGSQLAMLTSIQNQIDMMVPQGFCLTLAAFNTQLQATSYLEESIKKIIQAIREGQGDSIQSACSDAVEKFATCKLSKDVEGSVLMQLSGLFGDNCHQVALAIRSSAAGEDGGEASSAGQMETFLGVRGHDTILESVRKCWASAYTYQAVQYRRQHGQPIKTAVGVVIQEMVQSEVSGVLFTNDPVSGNPSMMVLDASYGLGEVVVSGKTTPDTIRVQRGWDDSLKILEKSLGNKNVKISLTDTGVATETITNEAGSFECCLTDDQILNICQVGREVEEFYGSGRDIEWALHQNKLYLLQARPITTLNQESDDDIIHEFDSPLATGQERNTLGNIGEMMPGCVTPLTWSVFSRAVNDATSLWTVIFAGGCHVKNSSRIMVSYSGRLFFNLTCVAAENMGSFMYQKKALEMNMIGEVLEDHTEKMIASFTKGRGFISKLLTQCTFYWKKEEKRKIAEAWDEKLKTYQLYKEGQTTQELYNNITEHLPDYWNVWETTLVKSAASGMWGGVVMGIVSGGKDEWTVDNYADVGLLLSQCSNVYSAEVPSAMQDLATSIVEGGLEEEFLSKSDTECVELLASDKAGESLSQKYQTFLERHGHRCIREAEFREKSWRSEPEKLTQVLKTIIKSKAYVHKVTQGPSVDEAVSKLKSPISAVGKFLLRKYFVPRARHAVGQREWGKSIAVNMADKFKEAYWRLSQLLKEEGRLPEGDLMFFLTHCEIGKLLETRSAKLISKAIRRRNILPVQFKIEYPKMSIGHPQPIQNETEEEERKPSFTLKGMPVSQGSVTGTARVVTSLEEASTIQKGDILIVCYTDIGWSPYFPLIAGLVTEMGGLVSHGAVVAREYGLPCVVNVAKATRLLQSGDMVHLDGATGSIQKLE